MIDEARCRLAGDDRRRADAKVRGHRAQRVRADSLPTSSTRHAGLRVGIATLFSPNEQNPCVYGIGCAFLPWCMAARTLQSGLLAHPQFMRVDILVVHNNRRANATKPAPPQPAGQPGTVRRLSDATEQLDVRDCPGVRLLTPTPAMRKVSLAHAKRVIGGGVMSYNQEYIERGYVFLWKWELFRLGRRYVPL